MKIAWTTVATRPEAERLAASVIEGALAVCAQIDGPISSHYRWNGKVETGEEFRLTLKCLPEQLPALARHVHRIHPYATPQWIVVSAEEVGEKYLSWAKATSSPSPL